MNRIRRRKLTIVKKFSNLSAIKQEQILKAALQEFTEYGYKNASTNRIIKKAGISKGALFYYFNNKRELLNYLIKYAIDYIFNEYINKINESEPDFIERSKQIAEIKMKAYIKHPEIFNFIGVLSLENDFEVPEESQIMLFSLKESGFAKLFNNIDISLFKDDIDPNYAIKIINWSLEGFAKEIINSIEGKKIAAVNVDLYWDEFYELLDILKKIVYK